MHVYNDSHPVCVASHLCQVLLGMSTCALQLCTSYPAIIAGVKRDRSEEMNEPLLVTAGDNVMCLQKKS